ncbi:hypothetical protein [Burkholderia cenocepacia]|nr:hypothetical protein [Burkholderia cenocepacia]
MREMREVEVTGHERVRDEVACRSPSSDKPHVNARGTPTTPATSA